MAMDLCGINNYNEYYTNHYFSSVFEVNAAETITAWRAAAKDEEGARTPWSLLRDCGRLFSTVFDRYQRVRSDAQVWPLIKDMADSYLASLGYPPLSPFIAAVGDGAEVPVYHEMKKSNGAPLLWVLLAHSADRDADLLSGYFFDGAAFNDDAPKIPMITEIANEELITKALFSLTEPPRWLIIVGISGIALVDRNKWNEKRYLYFDLEEIFSRREESTLQAMAVLLHRESLCPDDGSSLLDKLDDNSYRHASGVSQDLKYALREAIELLGNEVLYDLETRLGRDLDADPVDAGQLTIECLRYMYRMLFMLFIEARPELGYAPMKAQAYVEGYSLEFLRDIADDAREDVEEVGGGHYLHEALSKLYGLIYNGYPATEEELKAAAGLESLHDVFVIEPLKAHIFDPEYTKMISKAKLRNTVMLKIIDLMSISRGTGRRGSRGRISYSTLGINQMGAVYEALLSYRGFIADETLFEVKRAKDNFDELEVGYFIPERELHNYAESERVRYDDGKLRKYDKGTFIYRLAGREREKSASYYTPEVLTKCLVKYALKELLEAKTADEILSLTVCEPAMGSAAFLNEAINQLAEAYIDRKQQETGDSVSFEDRFQEIQRVKMYIADRNVYGIDLNPIAVELAEVSLWLNTIFKGGFVPWFGTQLINGNSLIGARRQAYRVEQLETNHSPDRWWENAPARMEPGSARMPKKQVYHFLMGDPGMSSYTDKVIKSLAPDGIKAIKHWNREFIKPYCKGDIETLLRISGIIDDLWERQVALQREVDKQTADALSVYGHTDVTAPSHTTIREKDLIFKKLYKTEGGDNASPYARLKFAMDYWCALWFWPIDKSDLLPSRSEFLFDMDLILEGGIVSVNLLESRKRGKNYNPMQTTLFPTDMQELANEIIDTYSELGRVNLDKLCEKNPRLALAKNIASEQRFMHWELEFASLFADRGGFDLILGNPPWIKMTWNEKDVLSETEPRFAIRRYSATQVMQERERVLSLPNIKSVYLNEYSALTGIQNFISSIHNYLSLQGLQGNLYEGFLPQSVCFCKNDGVFALIHPESVFSDSNGVEIRKLLIPRIRRHYRFSNALKLFQDVHTSREFGINIYCNKAQIGFEQIVNLYNAKTIDECYDGTDTGVVNIRNENGTRNINGHKDRIVSIGKKELLLFANVIDGTDDWNSARPLILHTKQLLDVLPCFDNQAKRLYDYKESLTVSMLWDETNAQKDGTIVRNVHFGNPIETILSGAHIGIGNPLFNCSNENCSGNNDNTSIDLQLIPKDYIQRTNYAPNCTVTEYLNRVPKTPWGTKYTDCYRIVARKMIDIDGERTLMPSLIPPKYGHTNGIIGFAVNCDYENAILLAVMSSLPCDFFIKICGKGNLQMNTAGMIIAISASHVLSDELVIRACLLNCLTEYYAEYWKSVYKGSFNDISWSKVDSRLNNQDFRHLEQKWSFDYPLKDAFSRRQALLEIDVLVAMSLGMTFEQLLLVYRIQFAILQQHEKDTYYDCEGRIVYTKNNALTNVGLSRSEFEGIVHKITGTVQKTYIDDTQPGGPVQRTIEYVAPFDRCDRVKDYETAWKFFEEKYNSNKEAKMNGNSN